MEKITIRDGGTTSGGAVYCLGLIGAVVYYFQHADTFGQYVIGFLKALVWPAFFVHKAMEFLGL
jgi:hypothetical protein